MAGHSRSVSPPGILNASAAVVVLLLVAVLAVRANQASTPAIAEFAPQAEHPIQQAPSELTSKFGSGSNGEANGAAPSPTPPAAPGLSPGAVVKHCVGDPPRQIEDPQSPPCVAFWQGDNGGSTWKGVSGSEINVAIGPVEWSTKTSLTQAEKDLQEFFNTRFELYGRKINLEPWSPSGCSGSPDPALLHADAAYVDSSLHAFASMGYCKVMMSDVYYYDDLAQRHVVSAIADSSVQTESHYQQHDPYEWTYLPPLDSMERQLGDFACRALVNRPARFEDQHAPVIGSKRVFGIITTTNSGVTAPDSILSSALAACGSPVADEVTVDNGFQTDPALENAVVSMQSKGVTTIMCLCDGGTTGFMMNDATGQHYFPEWYLPSFLAQDDEYQADNLWPASQAQDMFGISFYSRYLPHAEQPWVWAVDDVDPGYQWQPGGSQYETDNLRIIYSNLLLLVSGFQMAGARLTPQAFGRGLVNADFPDPGAEGPPYYQGLVGFGPGRGGHGMQEDGVLIWYSKSDPPYQGEGAGGTFCYADGGRRYQLGSYPATDSDLFRPPCH